MRSGSKDYSIGIHFWIKEAQGHFLGTGRVQLLEYIKETGSITGGARAMKMSYRQAWQMVEDMNKRASTPLVEKTLGGKGGGGAALTETGMRAIKLFHRQEEKIKKFAMKLSKEVTL